MFIRQATPDDLSRMDQSVLEFASSSKLLRTANLHHWRDSWTELLRVPSAVLFVMLDEQGAIVGTIGGMAYPDMLSGELVATEFHWFVQKQHRGQGIDLYREFERWAIDIGCSQIHMVHLADLNAPVMARVYRRLGFQEAEIRYSKTLRTQQEVAA